MQDYSNFIRELTSEQKLIFNLLQKNTCMTKRQISEKTGIKLTTLKYMMEPLIKNRLIVESKIGKSTGGRKPLLYDVNIHGFYLIGIDISIMYTQVTITNLKIGILEKRSFLMDASFSPKKTVETIANIIEQFYIDLHLADKKLMGIGLGSVGPLDIKTGIIHDLANFYSPEWKIVPIQKMLEERLRSPVTIENGVNAAAVAEHFYGVGKGIRNIAFFNCGIGIRTGSISSGKLIRSINDEEEAFSRMVIQIQEENRRQIRLECIEEHASIKSMIRVFCNKRRMGAKTLVEEADDDIVFDDICHAIKNRDVLATKTVTRAATVLGIGIANYIRLLDPKLVILSGPLITKSKLFYDTSVQSALEILDHKKGESIIFNRCGQFNQDAISVGAAAMVMERCLGSGI